MNAGSAVVSQVEPPGSTGHAVHSRSRVSARKSGAASFQDVLARHVRQTHHVRAPKEKSPSVIPADVDRSLKRAMELEGVPDSWRSGLRFIVAQESDGRVGVQNSRSSARGLFQLTRANWHYNPQGQDSFGNAVDEARGGIRYIKARYGTVDKAMAFWRRHHSY